MKVIIYPISDNPYQQLLFGKLSKNVEVKYLRDKVVDVNHAFVLGTPLFPLRFLRLRLQGWKIIHLHWLLAFVFPVDNFLFRLLSTIYVVLFIFVIKLFRFKLVWTLHEIIPHKQEFIDDLKIRKFISRMSNATIYHSTTALDEGREAGFSMKNTHVIPMGNFMTTYKNDITSDEARRKLNLRVTDFVILFFGLIKPYKGVGDLLEAYGEIYRKNKNAKLLIAGRCEDDETFVKIKSYKKKYKNSIITFIENIPDENVQVLLNASDIVALPYRINTSSSAAILAFSFKKPILAPLIGSFKDLPKSSGFYYVEEGLEAMIQKAIDKKKLLPQMGATGYKEMKKLSWGNAAKLTENVYEDIVR